MSFNYGEVLQKAWQIIWKFKILWVFGILASCGRSNGTPPNNNSRYSFEGSGPGSGWGDAFAARINRFFDNIEGWQAALLVLGIILFILLAIFITNYVGTVGRIGLVKGTVKGDQGAAALTFAELLQTGGTLFWRVFWLNLLAGLVVLFGVLMLLLPFLGFAAITMGLALLCLIPLMCLLVPVFWVVGLYLEQANISLIVEESTVGEALGRAWELVKKNIPVYVVMALILGVIGFILGGVLALPAIAAIFPVAGALILGGMAGSNAGLMTAALVALACCAVYVPIMLVADGILTSYITATWTLTYLRLTRPSAPTPPSP